MEKPEQQAATKRPAKTERRDKPERQAKTERKDSERKDSERKDSERQGLEKRPAPGEAPKPTAADIITAGLPDMAATMLREAVSGNTSAARVCLDLLERETGGGEYVLTRIEPNAR